MYLHSEEQVFISYFILVKLKYILTYIKINFFLLIIKMK